MSVCEKHRKFAAYHEELGKPQLECKFEHEHDGMFINAGDCYFYNNVDYRVAGDRHWELRKKWVDSGKTLPIETLFRGVWHLFIGTNIEWNQDAEYRESQIAKGLNNPGHQIIHSCHNEAALSKQVGGSHYKDMKIQPAEYNHANGIGHLAGDAIAYISRYKSKNGRQDLEKAIHSLQLLIQMEYGDE
jgi:hypothetical protein